jgi:hypothetical protein
MHHSQLKRSVFPRIALEARTENVGGRTYPSVNGRPYAKTVLPTETAGITSRAILPIAGPTVGAKTGYWDSPTVDARGCGASHQTGWTSLASRCLEHLS